MKTVALISGGKDSCFNLMCCIAEGHDVIALANLRPDKKDEIDSYMYQSVGHHAIDLYAEALGLPLFTQIISGSSLSTGRDYQPLEGDEVEDLYELLSRIKSETGVEAVSVGAILSDYQRVRVENVCQRLGLVSLSFLWRRSQPELLKEMIDCGVKAIIIKVAALGLDVNKHLGLQLVEIYPHMLKMRAKFGLNECGEGGEYETFVFDCPAFKKAIVIEEVEKVIHSDDAFAPVGYLNLKKCHLCDKNWDYSIPLRDQILRLPITTSSKLYNCNTRSGLAAQTPGTTSIAQIDTDEERQPQFSSTGQTFQVVGVKPVAGKEEDISTLAKRAMDLLMECVEERMGHSRSDIVSMSLYVANMADFAPINNVYKTYFGINPPVRCCVQVCLPPSTPLQLDCVGTVSDRTTMHVQGLSHWAPANIGPYSQAVCVNDRLYLAGIVPLIPATLQLAEGDVTSQCRLTLSHIAKVLTAMSPGCGLSHCPLVTCYLTSPDHVETARTVIADVYPDPSPLPLTVQCCVVPALPKAVSVECQVTAWPSVNSQDDVTAVTTQQHHDVYSLSLSCVHCKEREDLFSCRITLDVKNPEASNGLSAEEVVDNMMRLYAQHGGMSLSSSPSSQRALVKVFFVHTAFQYSELYQNFSQITKQNDQDTDQAQLCVSLIPVLGLDTPHQLLAWCQ